MRDNINHPEHYTQGKIECIDAMEAATVNKSPFEAICVGNIIKYLWRYEDKGGLEDIAKCNWYLNRLFQYIQERDSKYKIIASERGVGLQTPWGSLMVPNEGDMFNSKDEAREHLLKALLESGGYCTCQPQHTQDTMCPCIHYREKGKCICGLFVKIPQVMPKEEIQDAKIESERTDPDTEDGKEK